MTKWQVYEPKEALSTCDTRGLSGNSHPECLYFPYFVAGPLPDGPRLCNRNWVHSKQPIGESNAHRCPKPVPSPALGVISFKPWSPYFFLLLGETWTPPPRRPRPSFCSGPRPSSAPRSHPARICVLVHISPPTSHLRVSHTALMASPPTATAPRSALTSSRGSRPPASLQPFAPGMTSYVHSLSSGRITMAVFCPWRSRPRLLRGNCAFPLRLCFHGAAGAFCTICGHF